MGSSNGFSFGEDGVGGGVVKVLEIPCMYCAVSMPTGSKPLSGKRMVMLGFILILLRSFLEGG